MSLIRIRRARKKHWIDTKKGKPPRTLLMLFTIVAVLIWYLSTRF